MRLEIEIEGYRPPVSAGLGKDQQPVTGAEWYGGIALMDKKHIAGNAGDSQAFVRMYAHHPPERRNGIYPDKNARH
jgi:hypothetical protein